MSLGAKLGCARANSHLQQSNASFINSAEILVREELGIKRQRLSVFFFILGCFGVFWFVCFFASLLILN